MLRFLASRWFLIALAFVLVAGLALHDVSEEAAAGVPRDVVVASVLFLMALPLDIGEIRRAFRYPLPAGLAVAINAGLVPPLAWLGALLLPGPLGTGLLIITAGPTTLASAAVWTRRGGGNDAVALLVTMITNLACFLVVPLWLRLLTGTEVQLNFGDMTRRLALLVVTPIVVAQLLRAARPIASWATCHKKSLGIFAQLGILTMVWIGAVSSGNELESQPSAIGLAAWAVMILVVAGVHLVPLAFGLGIGQVLGIERGDRIAVAFAGSQKTLMVGLYVALAYKEVFGGLAIVPMVAFHVVQLVLDTLIADEMRRRGSP